MQREHKRSALDSSGNDNDSNNDNSDDDNDQLIATVGRQTVF
jgi:hypothetical protein